LHFVSLFEALTKESKSTPKSIAMISGYAKQVALIQTLLHKNHKLGENYWVRTVDSSQGREASVVILSLVRTNATIGFWTQLNRVCVALSRHIDLLIIVGSHSLFVQRNYQPWSQLMLCNDIQICTNEAEATASFLSSNPAADAKPFLT
jgi:superfamily I DNA and/or RNA helicase